MSTVITADILTVSVDSDAVTVDQGYAPGFGPGWPCAALPEVAPSVADRQSDPSPEDLLSQILALTPRGPAWGTDEVGDGSGASPMMRRFWSALAGWVARKNAREFEVATQAFPSAITFSLDDWEAELGLPDACAAGGSGMAARIAAVRARFGALGGQSPAYFICLAQSIGYTITIEEPTQFLVDVSECPGGDLVEGYFLCDESVCSGEGVEGYFLCDAGECDGDEIESYSLGGEGDGDPLETFALGVDYEADEVAGGLIETYVVADEGACEEPIEGFSQDPAGTVWQYWIVNVAALGETAFHVDDGACDTDPIEGFGTSADLECLLNRYSPEHTRLVYRYALAA